MTQEEDRLQHMISVMQAFAEGKEIEYRHGIDCVWYTLKISNPLWNWAECDYRIKSEPEREYIDLGLPSGTLWAAENEKGFYSFDEANEKFGDMMPSSDNFVELVRECYHKWDDVRKGIEFLSPYNGKKLFFPASGYRRFSCDNSVNDAGSYGYYWSSSQSDAGDYILLFYSSTILPSYTSSTCAYGYPVRCVKHKD